MKAQVYWNVHKRQYSVRHKGRVVDHSSSVVLTGVSFRVQPAGQRKVRETGQKNVHAYAAGERPTGLLCDSVVDAMLAAEKLPQVTYNPTKHDTFVRVDTGAPVHTAQAAVLTVHDNKPVIYTINPK